MKEEYQKRKVWARILPSNTRALAKREYNKKEVINDDVVNPTRVTPSFATKDEDEKINDCFNGFVCF